MADSGRQGQVVQMQLKREESSQSWGFRLRGGADQGIPVHVEGIAKNGRAHQGGLRPFDIILAIGANAVHGLSHDNVKAEILRAGNDLDLVVNRGAIDPQRLREAVAQQMGKGEPRSQIVEEPICKMGGPTFKPVKPKTYEILENQLPASQTGDAAPSSIFDRKKDDRSDYLHAAGKTIQSAYGEKS